MNYMIVALLVMFSANALAAKLKPDAYSKNGVIVSRIPWGILDYEIFYDFYEGGLIPLPKLGDTSTMYVFEKLISEDNLSILNSKHLSVEERFTTGSAFNDMLDLITMVYVKTHNKMVQNNERELAYMLSFHAKLNATRLELLNKIISGIPATKANATRLADLTLQRSRQTRIFDNLVNQFEREALYTDESFVVLSAAVLQTVNVYTRHFDKQDKNTIKNRIDSLAKKCENKMAATNLKQSVLKL